MPGLEAVGLFDWVRVPSQERTKGQNPGTGETKKPLRTQVLSGFHSGGVQDFKSEPKAAETSANDTVWVPFL